VGYDSSTLQLEKNLMAAPFYILFLPIFLIIAGALWMFYRQVVGDKDSLLRTRRKSDLEKAQDLERREAAAER
jgi:hypothetical protein